MRQYPHPLGVLVEHVPDERARRDHLEAVLLGPVDLRAIAERAIEEVGAEARAGGGSVTLRGDFPVIQGDDVLLRQAFSNLLRNAVQACAGVSVAPHVIVEGKREPGYVRVSIEDNGPGIPAADRDRANRALLETERVRLERVAERLATELDGNIFGGLFSNADAGLEQTRRKLAALDAVADVLERGDRQLLALDLSGREAMAAVAVGAALSMGRG